MVPEEHNEVVIDFSLFGDEDGWPQSIEAVTGSDAAEATVAEPMTAPVERAPEESISAESSEVEVAPTEPVPAEPESTTAESLSSEAAVIESPEIESEPVAAAPVEAPPVEALPGQVTEFLSISFGPATVADAKPSPMAGPVPSVTFKIATPVMEAVPVRSKMVYGPAPAKQDIEPQIQPAAEAEKQPDVLPEPEPQAAAPIAPAEPEPVVKLPGRRQRPAGENSGARMPASPRHGPRHRKPKLPPQQHSLRNRNRFPQPLQPRWKRLRQRKR